MAAALSSWKQEQVIFLLERNEYLEEFFLNVFILVLACKYGEELGTWYAETFIGKLNRTGVEVMTDTTVLELSGQVVKAVNSEGFGS